MMATRSSKLMVEMLRSGAFDAMSFPSVPWHKEHFMVYARLMLASEGAAELGAGEF
jgi:hypothetical protein